MLGVTRGLESVPAVTGRETGSQPGQIGTHGGNSFAAQAGPEDPGVLASAPPSFSALI